MYNDTITKRIFEEMKIKKITQSELAKKLGIGQSTVANWKKRNCPPPINYLEKLSEILEVSIDYLVTGTENPTKYKLTKKEQLLIREFRTTSEENQDKIFSLTLELADKTYYNETDKMVLYKTLQDNKEENKIIEIFKEILKDKELLKEIQEKIEKEDS